MQQPQEIQPLVDRHSSMGNQNGLTAVMSTFIILKGVIATGFLTIPLSISYAGIIPSLMAFLFAMIIFIISYIKVYQARRNSRGDYLDVIQDALGRKCKITTSIFIICSHFCNIVSQSSFIIDNLPKIVSGHQNLASTKFKIALPLFILLGVLAQFRRINNLRYFYSFGVFLTATTMIMIIAISIIRIVNHGFADTSAFIVSSKSPRIIGTSVFTFDFSPVMLNVAINMKNPSKFPVVVKSAYIIVCLTMIVATFLPYLAFSAHQILKSQFITETILASYDYWYIKGIIGCLSIGTIGTILLLTVPFFYSVEGFFLPSYEQSYHNEIERLRQNEIDLSQNKQAIFGKIGKYRTVIRAVLVFALAISAYFLSKVVNFFVSISQILFSLPLVSIIPILAHQRLVSHSKQQKAFDYLIIGITVSLMILTLILLFD